jgi:hypothetical protein
MQAVATTGLHGSYGSRQENYGTPCAVYPTTQLNVAALRTFW